MAIRYSIGISCPPRRELGDDVLSELVWKAHRLRVIEEDFARRGVSIDREGARFNERTVRPDGVIAERTVSLAEMGDEVMPLVALAPECRDCPASVTGTPFGCHATIAFPISALAEEWLVARIPAPGSSTRQIFVDSMIKFGWGSESRIPEWRRLGLLERDESLRVSDGSDGTPMTSDAILHALFMLGEVSPDHALGMLLITDAISTNDGRTGDELLQMLSEYAERDSLEGAPDIVFAIEPIEGENSGILELKRYLYALYIGFAAQAILRVEA
jgi:hypothetical protein